MTDLAESSSTQEDRGHKSAPVSREAFEEMRKELERAQMRAVVLRDELTLAKSKLATSSGEKEVELNGAVLESNRDSVVELKLKAELAEMKAEMAKKDEELRKKDGALAGKVEELKIKDEQIQELRRRLPRSLN